MTKHEWLEHARSVGEHDRKACPDCQARLKTKRHSAAARDRYQAMRSIGMVKTPYGWE